MKNVPEPDYIALKPPGESALRWYDRTEFPVTKPPFPAHCSDGPVAESIYQPSGKFVTGSDGAVAEIWELKEVRFTPAKKKKEIK
jgi:hypothetical protein